MLFDSEFFDKMRRKRHRFRPMLYIMAATPLVIYILGIVVLSTDRFRVFTNDLVVVKAIITKEPPTSNNGQIALTYPCQAKAHTATVTTRQLAQERSYTEEQIPTEFKTGDSINIGVNSKCEIKMLMVSQPPFLVYFLFTVFMVFLTSVWAILVFAIWKWQGIMLDSISNYLKRNDT